MTRNNFFVVTSALFFALALIGFTRSLYFRTYFEFPELESHLYVHGIALTAWFALAFMQPLLIRLRKFSLHRRLGAVGVVVAMSVVTTGLWTVALRDAPVIDEFPTRAAGNLASLIMFSACVTLGVVFRKQPATHKRLMLMASIPVLAPALDRIARIPILNEFFGRFLYWFPAPTQIAFATVAFLTLLLVVVVNDLVSERRVLAGTLWGLSGIFIITPAITYAVISSGLWVRFVHWFV